MTWIVWPGPHGSGPPICDSGRLHTVTQWPSPPACRSGGSKALSCSVGQVWLRCGLLHLWKGGRRQWDTGQGKGSFKGVTHALLMGGMMAGKGNQIARQSTRLLGLPQRHRVSAVQAAVWPACLWAVLKRVWARGRGSGC